MRPAFVWGSIAVGHLLSALAAAQQPVPAPVRDAAPQNARAGSAIVRGRVLAGDTGRPLRRVRITVISPELGREPRTTSTGLDGRYEVSDLPAGRYTVRAERGGYLTLRYGQTRPLEQGSPLDVRERETVERVDFTLPPAGVIAGRVVDELGETVADVPVFAMGTAYWQGRRRLVPVGTSSRTDDAGEYRVSGLMPGTYLVMAVLRETWTVRASGVERTFGYAPTYFPGTAAVAEAQRVTLRVGQRLGSIDLALVAGRAATISGIATDAAGRPLAGRFVGLGREISGPDGASFMVAGGAPVVGDGSFTIKNIPPGQYKLRVQAPTAGSGPNESPELAVLPISIDGADLPNITLTTSSGWSIAGRIVKEDGTLPQGRPDAFGLSANSVDADTAPDARARNADDGRIQNDWTVRVGGVFGAARVRARVPNGWWVKAILHDGRDISDTPTEMRSGEELTDLRIVVSDRPTSVRGQLVDAKGTPLKNGTIVVFAREPDKWFEESRWVRATRPDQQGSYRIDGLPPGEYLAVAVDYVEEGTWNDASFIESLREHAEPFTLAEGETRTVVLKLLTP